MNCYDIIQKLNSYLDGELSAPDVKKVESHLSICQSCATELKSIQELNATLDAMPSMCVPSNFAEEIVKNAISQRVKEYNISFRWRSLTYAWKAAACAAALTGLLMGGFFAKTPFGHNERAADVNKILFSDNEPSLTNSYIMALLNGGKRR